ncbi:hypothetical protein LTR49_012096 [Elasticomyces elasticus]|nr:hypothetical protein LTR49_012096 [Elasticomyces elasticus]
MPRSSIDKSFAAAPVSPAFNQPNSADFLPKYEETLNHNLRNSGDPEAQYGPVDRRIQEPDLKYGLTKKRRAIVVGSLIALVIIIGAVLAGLLTAKISSAKQQVSTSSNATITTIVTKPTLQTPLSTRATMLQPQGTTTALAESKSHPTKTAAATPSVISLTTLITTTVAGPSSKLFTSFLTAKPQTTQASDSLPLVVSTTAFWTKTAPDASFEIYTIHVLQLQSNIDANFYKHILRANGKQVHHRFGAVESAGSSDAFAKHVEPGSGAGAATTNHCFNDFDCNACCSKC